MWQTALATENATRLEEAQESWTELRSQQAAGILRAAGASLERREVAHTLSLKVQLLTQSLCELASLADLKAAKHDFANAFHGPLGFLTSETNLANRQAAEHQHPARPMRSSLFRDDSPRQTEADIVTPVRRYEPTTVGGAHAPRVRK
jgi:hypothetical protein